MERGLQILICIDSEMIYKFIIKFYSLRNADNEFIASHKGANSKNKQNIDYN